MYHILMFIKSMKVNFIKNKEHEYLMKIISHRHTGLIVNDLDKMLDFYLGWV